MSLSVFFKNKISIYRLTKTIGDANKEDYQLNGTIYGSIFPMDAESAMMSEGNPTKSHILVAALDADLQETDKIVYDSVNYIVKGVKKISLQSINVKECVIEEPES